MAEGPVEGWLGNIETMMFKTLYDLTKEALKVYPENALERNQWFFDHPAQSILCVDQIIWTQNAAEVIQKNGKSGDGTAYTEFIDFSNDQIQAMVALVR
jgi:dynein heavy chain